VTQSWKKPEENTKGKLRGMNPVRDPKSGLSSLFKTHSQGRRRRDERFRAFLRLPTGIVVLLRRTRTRSAGNTRLTVWRLHQDKRRSPRTA
jgi:hypothetical protein